MAIAHTRPAGDERPWHDLQEHLHATARRAEEFAKEFAPGWAHLAGLWHDLGKYQPRFQEKLRRSGAEDGYDDERVEHAIIGAAHAGTELRSIANCIAGHHGDLKKWAELKGRLEKEDVNRWYRDAQEAGIPEAIVRRRDPGPLPFRADDRIAEAMFTRFLYSALVDADSLDTEAWAESRERAGVGGELGEMAVRLDEHLAEKFESSKKAGVAESGMNRLRREVLEDCRKRALDPPGHYTLTVPTGGGKTLSALAFALGHALRHEKRRVITVLPYTTILEQTVKAYRTAIGPEGVVEHHSNVDVEMESLLDRQATENWDAPVIVTTSVQFLESLYSSRKKRCRKLHNVINSVVILDEVQTFPLEFLKPIQMALDFLVKHLKVTIVHCTATQPRLAGAGAMEIISDPKPLFAAVADRYETIWPVGIRSGKAEVWDTTELARRVGEERESVLVIVHRRDEAEEVARSLGDDVYHLSARMCALHRGYVLEQIKEGLREGRIVRVVSTQLVEAGVDLDFPVVYRAAAGLDTLAQAAGRCNREGRRRGRFVVFKAATKPPAEVLWKSLAEAEMFLQVWDEVELGDPGVFPKFFSSLARRVDRDKRSVLESDLALDFPESARRFRLIPEVGYPVIAPYGDGWKKKVQEIRYGGVTRERLRLLQPYLVQLYEKEIRQLSGMGSIERLADKVECFGVVSGYEPLVYDRRFGFGWHGGDGAGDLLMA